MRDLQQRVDVPSRKRLQKPAASFADRYVCKEVHESRAAHYRIVKTGIIAHYSSNYRTILPPSVPRSLVQGAVVPAGIKVFGGNVKSQKTIRWVQSNIGVALVQQSDISKFETGKNTFVFVLSICNIFIGFGWHGLNKDKFEIVIRGNSVERVYPHPEPAKRPIVFEDLMLATAEIALHRRRV